MVQKVNHMIEKTRSWSSLVRARIAPQVTLPEVVTTSILLSHDCFCINRWVGKYNKRRYVAYLLNYIQNSPHVMFLACPGGRLLSEVPS
jgi:hypothetical protein